MVLIILSWIYIIFTTINLGFLTNKVLSLKNDNFVITSILGLFGTTILASIWAVFGRINIEFHLFLLLINLLIFIKYKSDILNIYSIFKNQFRSLELVLKSYLIIITFLIIAQCASIPYVIDNESYYIQTIKWLNEYGFVRGLVNLHFFLGQLSGWHVTQSAFNFSFLYQNFNDLSGFCLLLGNVFAIEKLSAYFKNNNKIYLIIGLLPFVNLLFFQFISAPSPDIPVYIFSFILFFYFLTNFKSITVENFNFIVLLVLFLLYIKNTTLVFLLIPIVLLKMNYKLLAKNLVKPFVLACLVLSLFILKNMIICGSPVFPYKLFSFTSLEYAIPDQMERFYYNELKLYGYFVEAAQYKTMSGFDLFIQWLSLPKLNGLFNKSIVFLIVICPFFIYKFFNKKAFWIVYFLMIVQLLLLFKTSPQFRFFINYVIFFSLFCFTCIFYQKKIVLWFLYLSLIPTFLIVFLPIDLNNFSNYKFMQSISNFKLQNSIYPYKNTKSDRPYETIVDGNLKYHSPLNNDFFWGSGNGDLPCVNKVQIAYFKKYFYIVPQMRTNNMKDGFYPKKVNPNEP